MPRKSFRRVMMLRFLLKVFVSDFLHQILRNEQTNHLLYQEIKQFTILISKEILGSLCIFIRLLKLLEYLHCYKMVIFEY